MTTFPPPQAMRTQRNGPEGHGAKACLPHFRTPCREVRAEEVVAARGCPAPLPSGLLLPRPGSRESCGFVVLGVLLFWSTRQPEEGNTSCFSAGVEWVALWHPAGLPGVVGGERARGHGGSQSHRRLKWKCDLDII